MQLYDLDHVYRCEIPGYENTGLYVHMKVVTSKEFDSALIESAGLTPEGVSEKTNQLIQSKVAEVEGYDSIKTGAELYEKGHPDIWDFVKKAVFRARILGASEVKN